MAKTDGVTTIKKYANRRLYNTGTSTYVTLEDLADMVKNGEDFIVQDAKSTDDITHTVLTQIIFEQEAKTGENMLPVSVLRQLIAFYGDQMQAVVPSYLEASMSAFGKEQERFREQMTGMIGKSPTDVMSASKQMIEEQTRRNMDAFQNAMKLFNPFMAGLAENASPAPQETTKPTENADLDEMKKQIAEMQRKLDSLK